MAKQTLYKTPPSRAFIKLKDKIAEECFKNCYTILPICKHLEYIVKDHYPKSKTFVLYQGIDPTKWYKEEGMKLKRKIKILIKLFQIIVAIKISGLSVYLILKILV